MKKIWNKHQELGERIPLLYLPVHRDRARNVMVCYFFLVAPVILLWCILSNAFTSIWYDIVEYSDLLNEFRKTKWRQLMGKKLYKACTQNESSQNPCLRNMSKEQWAQDECSWTCEQRCPYEETT